MADTTNKDAALRKRQQIAKANKMMFLWVAVASASVGIAAVVTFSLYQHFTFNNKILKEMYLTIDNLKHNNKIADDIKQNVRVLNTNKALLDLRVEGEEEPVQVVLDALPSTANSAAFGASLQSSKLLGQPGAAIESLTVDSTGSEGGADGTASSAPASDATLGENTIGFKFTINTPGNDGGAKMKQVLQSLEKSIRGINLTKVDLEIQGTKYVMNATGNGYYQPGFVIKEYKDMDTKPVSPKDTPKSKGAKK